MSAPRHTPGPWSFDADGCIRSYDDASRVQGNAMNVGSVCYGFKPLAQMEADGRLIAAAPDMLAALQLFCDLDTIAPLARRERFNEAVQVAVDKARAALAKAGVQS